MKPVVRFRPTKDGVEEPFYDVPWAVHIPIEVPFEGGGATITWQARVSWENAPQEWYEQTFSLPAVGRGIYRLDGKRLTQLAVRRGSYALKWETDVPLPTYIWDATYSSAFNTEKEKHKPMVGLEDDAIVIEPVLPGWYAMWFVFDTSSLWPGKEPKREFLQGVVHFDCIVSRGLGEPTSAEKEYLFGRGKRPDKMQDDKFYIVTTIEVPFKLRRDGWEFDHSEVHLIDDDRKTIGKKRVRYGDKYNKTYSNYTVSEKASGKEVELNLTEKIQTNPRGEITDAETPDNDSAFDTVYIWDEKWKASFPPSLADNSFGSVQFTGGREGHYQQKGQFGTSASGTYSRWDPSGPWMVMLPENPGSTWLRTVRSPTEKRFEPYEKKARDDFQHDYGKDALEWFVPDYFEDYGTGLKKGEPPAQYVIQAKRPSLRDAAPLELGPYPLVAFHVGPWEICGFYKRLSEIENRTVASKAQTGETTIVSDEDDFWKWYPGLSEVIHKQKDIADRAVADAALETLPLQKLLKSQKRLLFSISQNAPGGVGESIAGWLDNEFPKIGVGTLPGGSEEGSVNTPAGVSDKERTLLQNKLGEITEDIRHARERISDRTEEARAAYKAICDKLEEGNDKFGGPAHGELYIWRQHYRKIYEQISFDIALASKDPEVLRRALADAEKETNSDLTRVLEAELHIALGDQVGALTALRSAVEVNPDNVAAQMMLRDLECAFLKAAIDKSQGTIAEARRAFYGYMLERGFKEYHQLRTSSNWPFARAAAWAEYALDKYSEVPWAIFTTGLFGSMSALVDREGGKPAAEADLLDTVEKRMVTAFIGLNTVLRLRNNGYKFDDIKKMTSIQIREALPLRKINGELYSDQEAALHRVAIRVAMEDLPDVKALVSNDQGGLQLGLEKKYWNERDVGDTWIEWIGDATSVYNLLQLLPSAKVGAGARIGKFFWGEKELEALRAYEKSGEVISGTEFIANTIGVTDVLSQAGATDTGKAILKYFKAIGRYQEDLGWLDTIIWTTGKLTALMGIDYMTVSAGEKVSGHKGGMLMQFLMMFVRDPETLLKLLDARNIPREACAALIIDRYLPGTKLHIKRLVQIEKNGAELERLFERVKAGQRLMPQDQIFLDKYFKSDWHKLIPNGQASHDAEIALGAAAEGARNNVDNGAGKAVAERMKGARQAEMEETTQAADQGQQLANQLQGGQPPARGPPPPPTVDPPTPPRDLQRVLAVTRRTPGEEMANLPRPPAPPVRSETAKAERLLHAGKYVEAQLKYEDIMDLILKGQLQEADELPLEWLHMKRCLAYKLQVASRKFPKTPSVINTAIPLAEAEAVFNNRASWVARSKAQSGALSEVFDVAGNDEYFVREVKAQFDYVHDDGRIERKVIDVANDVRCNLVHTELARAMAFDVSAMEVRVFYDAQGNAERAVYVMRKVKGKRLCDLSAAEIFLYKDELSRHRALAVLIGDYDRKLDNYLVTEQGHLVPIDAGVADVTGERWKAAGFEIDDPATLGGYNGRDHWYSRYFKDELGKGRNAPYVELWDPKEEIARKNMLAEQALTYQASKPMVEEIRRIVLEGLPAQANGKKLDQILQEAYIKVLANEGDIQRVIQRAAQLRGLNLSDPAVVAQLREEAQKLLQGRAVQAAEKSRTLLKARAPKIDDCMQGLNERSGLGKPGGSNQSWLRLPSDQIFEKVVLLHILNNNANLRKAA
ncbi:MAG TPA: hypothetical protein VN281_14820 [Verrucomicrobiae bacterium]|nr:hypothetical protein [Verrucomicrobiae bacterium]